MANFTHLDEKGNARMVDVSEKAITQRIAIATGTILMSQECFLMVEERKHKKGDVLTIAEVGGIMASKKTSELIPLTHLINLENVEIRFESINENNTFGYKAFCKAKTTGKTGVEMEALTGVSLALLTIYDMCKSIDKKMTIKDIHLVEKHGGKSGDFYF